MQTILSRLQIALDLPTEVTEEVPQPGTLPGTWALAHTPIGTPAVYWNGVRQRATLDYSLNGATLASSFWPPDAQLVADYRY